MVAEYTVKRNGKWYKAGDEIPNIAPGEKSSSGYTKTEINRMSTADLQSLAAEHGIEGAEEISGAELKRILIEQFGL
jgi:hypothetical protein